MPLFIVSDHQEAELSGDIVALRDLRAKLAEFLLGGGSSTEVPALQQAESTASQPALAGVRFVLAPGPAKVLTQASILEIQGSRDNLQRFSTFLSFDDSQGGAHHHFEYVPGSAYVAQDSLPLIVSCHPQSPNKSLERTRDK
jgi:hypothetical protein